MTCKNCNSFTRTSFTSPPSLIMPRIMQHRRRHHQRGPSVLPCPHSSSNAEAFQHRRNPQPASHHLPSSTHTPRLPNPSHVANRCHKTTWLPHQWFQDPWCRLSISILACRSSSHNLDRLSTTGSSCNNNNSGCVICTQNLTNHIQYSPRCATCGLVVERVIVCCTI